MAAKRTSGYTITRIRKETLTVKLLKLHLKSMQILLNIEYHLEVN